MTLTNELFTMDVPAKGATKGHVRFELTVKEPEEIGAAALAGIVTSAMLFERLQAHWTHMIIGLRPKDSRMDVIARWEDDGLDLTWQPKTVEPNRMEELAGLIRDRLSDPTPAPPVKPLPPTAPTFTTPLPAQTTDREEAPVGLADGMLTEEEQDYRVKQLLRIP